MQDEPTNTNVVEEVVADVPQEEPVVDTPVDTPVVDEPVAETPSEELEPQVDTPAVEPESQSGPSRREQLRIKDLLGKYGRPGERPAPSKPTGMDYSEALNADPATIQQLEADRTATGQAQYNEGLKRAEFLNWNTSLKIDAPRVETQYPVINPKSPEFNPAVADAVNTWYLNMSGYDRETDTVANPTIGYGDFVEGFMELVQETAGRKNAATVKNVAQQAATTGLRPDGSSAKPLDLNKDPSQMSLEELYASIGQKPPKK